MSSKLASSFFDAASPPSCSGFGWSSLATPSQARAGQDSYLRLRSVPSPGINNCGVYSQSRWKWYVGGTSETVASPKCCFCLPGVQCQSSWQLALPEEQESRARQGSKADMHGV